MHTFISILGAVNYHNSYFGNHPIPLGSYFNCYGNESSLSSCQNSTSSCNSVTDAVGVYCTGEVITGNLRDTRWTDAF